MTPTVDILGIQIPRAGSVFYAVLAVHVPAALAAVILGALAALTRKGSCWHDRSGRLYFWALCVVFTTATILATMRLQEDYDLLLIGTTAITAAGVGHLSRKRHRPGHAPHILGMGASYIAMLVAFYVDNGAQLPIWDRLPHATYWLLPPVVGVPTTWSALRRARRLM